MFSPSEAFPFLQVLLYPMTTCSLLLFLLLFGMAALFSPAATLWRRSSIPVAGGTFLSESAPHRALSFQSHCLDATRLMAFSIGLTRFVVSSHPESAKEILNSSAFSHRPIKESARELLFHRAIGFSPMGEYWRNLRRISSSHLFSPRRISALGGVRAKIGHEMAAQVRASMDSRGELEVRRLFHFASLNNILMTVFGRRIDFGNGEGAELERMVREGYELLGVLNWSDHIPFLSWLDLQGVRRRCRDLVQQVNVFVGNIVEEHRTRRRRIGDEAERIGDFVDVLLDVQAEEKAKLSDSDMVAVLWEMIFRGTDTVAILLEWIMARMILHPEIQAKAQEEISGACLGKSGPVSDADIPNLPYLQAIVKESLRMHPPGPLLSWARLAVHDVYVGEHFVPAGTTAMVNMWAITHDKAFWDQPDEFKPERFLTQDVSIMGSDMRLAPFGSGKRICPGKALGLATVHLWLAQLLQCFEWVPSTRGVDLEECLKMSLEMKNPLVCCAMPREC